MKFLVASVFALSLLGSSAASADILGVGVHIGGVGASAHIGGGHHHRHGCRSWGYRHHHRYCRRSW